MRLSCLQENLNRGLSVVGRAVATRTTLPITNNVLLTVDQSRLKLAATNLEMAISCWIGAKVEGLLAPYPAIGLILAFPLGLRHWG